MALTIGIVPVTLFEQNCTLIFDEATKKGVVVDPGGDVDRIMDAIKQTGMTVERILLTHGHVDHAAGAMELKEKLGGIPIEGPHKGDKPLLDTLEKTAQNYGIAGARKCTPDRWLDGGDHVMIAGERFDCLHCPGHSPGSIVFYNKKLGFALVGDVLFRGSIGRTDLPMGDHATLITSIKTKLFPIGDEIEFICGHGPPGRIGEERMSNPFVGEAAND